MFARCRKAFVDGLTPWEVPAKLKFRQITSGTPIMEVEFVNGKHLPCGYKFDGRGKLLMVFYYFPLPAC